MEGVRIICPLGDLIVQLEVSHLACGVGEVTIT